MMLIVLSLVVKGLHISASNVGGYFFSVQETTGDAFKFVDDPFNIRVGDVSTVSLIGCFMGPKRTNSRGRQNVTAPSAQAPSVKC